MIDNIVFLIPSLDPDERLVRTVEGMLSAGVGRVLLVNDGSSQSNMWPFEKLKAHPEVTVIGYEENQGKGYALKYGFTYVLENMENVLGVVTCDGDGQHLATDCLKVATALQERDEFIFGCRNFKDKTVPLHNKLGNKISIFMYNFFCSIKLSDTQTGLRGIPFRYLKSLVKIEGARFEYETNTLIYMTNEELPYSEVAINTVYEEGSNDRSHFKVFKDSASIYKLILKAGGPRFLKFMMSSLMSSVVDLGVFTLMTWVISHRVDDFIAIVGSVFIATFVARVCSSLFNYFVNKNRIFKDSKPGSIGRFYILVACQLTASALFVSVLSHIFGAVGPWQTLIKCIVDGLLFLVSYTVQREWVFR